MSVSLLRIIRAASVGIVSLAAVSCVDRPPYQPDGNVFITDRPPRYGHGGTDSPNYRDDTNRRDNKPPKNDTGEDPSRLHDKPDNNADAGNNDRDTTPPPTTGNDTPPADTGNKPPPATKPNSELPYGSPVIGKKGFVYSPYAPEQGMVDVTDIPSGTKVECPYTHKVFRVP